MATTPSVSARLCPLGSLYTIGDSVADQMPSPTTSGEITLKRRWLAVRGGAAQLHTFDLFDSGADGGTMSLVSVLTVSDPSMLSR
jgi:hypothetical protein